MARRWIVLLLFSFGLGSPPPERPAGGVTLRMAAIAPAGTSWARLLSAFADEIERSTHGKVVVKWQLGGIAGDEATTLERVRRGELAGLAGAIFCQRVSPSLHAVEVAGLTQTDDEATEVMQRLRPLFEEEAAGTPFRILAMSPGFGHRVLFSREPVRSLADLRKGRWWIYDLDELEREQLALMGVTAVPLPIDEAAHAYDGGRVDGFVSIPWAAVAYRYGVKARYFTDLHSMFLPACMIVSRAAFDGLDKEGQDALVAAGAHIEERFKHLGKREHSEMLERAFPREGLRAVPMSEQFQKDFLEAARTASAHLGPRLAPLPLVRRVNAILAEMRAGGVRTARAPP
jgi:TRAP-type C4-dicarboxylate transport system substrate-binding protein